MNALCNLSRKKSPEVAASLPGQFLSRLVSHCVQQWKLNLELRSSTNATTVTVGNDNGRVKGMKGGQKVSMCRFLAVQKIASSGGKTKRFGAYPMARVIASCQTHSPKMPLKLAV